MWTRTAHVRGLACTLALVALASCRQAPEAPRFPKPDRDVAPIVSDAFSTEDARDRVGEAERVIELAGVKPGMWVADIVEETVDLLGQRVHRENLDNVAILLGTPDDPKLPHGSFDRIFLVHMYHEVASPYAFLWRLREGLKLGGEVIVVDSNREPKRHGMPPNLLRCEFGQVGLKLARFEPITARETYFAAFQIAAPRPDPSKIRACRD